LLIRTRPGWPNNGPIHCGTERVGSCAMNGQIEDSGTGLASRIARLVEERGWNQEDFARHTGLNRQTVRQILLSKDGRRLRNGTVSRCAKALGLSVSELRNMPLDRLLLRMTSFDTTHSQATAQRLYDMATQPALQAWIDRNPARASQLTG